MTLDARVYRNRKHLSFDPETLGAIFDEETGAVDFDVQFADTAAEEKYLDECIVVEKFLGNVHLVKALREEVSSVLPEDSVVQTAVLCNGTHTGDWIPVAEIPRLEQELERLLAVAKEKRSERLQEFVDKMSELVAAAKAEGNPIVF